LSSSRRCSNARNPCSHLRQDNIDPFRQFIYLSAEPGFRRVLRLSLRRTPAGSASFHRTRGLLLTWHRIPPGYLHLYASAADRSSTIFMVDGSLVTPPGQRPNTRLVWVVDAECQTPPQHLGSDLVLCIGMTGSCFGDVPDRIWSPSFLTRLLLVRSSVVFGRHRRGPTGFHLRGASLAPVSLSLSLLIPLRSAGSGLCHGTHGV